MVMSCSVYSCLQIFLAQTKVVLSKLDLNIKTLTTTNPNIYNVRQKGSGFKWSKLKDTKWLLINEKIP